MTSNAKAYTAMIFCLVFLGFLIYKLITYPQTKEAQDYRQQTEVWCKSYCKQLGADTWMISNSHYLSCSCTGKVQ